MTQGAFDRDSLKSSHSTGSTASGKSAISGLEAIRARRARLEALTAQMKLPQLTPNTADTQKSTDNSKFLLHPDRKLSSYGKNRRRPSVSVKLEPMNSGPIQENELDRRVKEDKLIQRHNIPRTPPGSTQPIRYPTPPPKATTPPPQREPTPPQENENHTSPVKSTKSKAGGSNLLDLWKQQDDDALPHNKQNERIVTPVSPKENKSNKSHTHSAASNRDATSPKSDEKISSSLDDVRVKKTTDIFDSESDVDKEENPDSDTQGSTTENSTTTNQEVLDVIEMLKNDDEFVQRAGAQTARRHLSSLDNPPIDAYIEAGIIPLLNECLKKDQNSSLQFESLWALTNIGSGTTQQAQMICDQGCLPEMIRLLASPEDSVADQAVWAVSNLAGDSSVLRDQVVDAGALPQLQKLVHRKPTTIDNTLFFLKNLAWGFSNILRHKPVKLTLEQIEICVEAVRLFVHHTDRDIHTSALWSLAYVADGEGEQIQLVVNSGVIPRIIELLESKERTVIMAAVRSTGNILTGSDQQTDEVVAAGVVRPLVKLLDHDASTIVKEAVWCLSNILAGTPAQIEVVITSGALLKIGEMLLQKRHTEVVLKECIWCLVNLTSSGNKDQIEKLIYYDGIEAIAISFDMVDSMTTRVGAEGLINILDASDGFKNKIEETLDPGLLRREINRDTSSAELSKKILKRVFNEEM